MKVSAKTEKSALPLNIFKKPAKMKKKSLWVETSSYNFDFDWFVLQVFQKINWLERLQGVHLTFKLVTFFLQTSFIDWRSKAVRK